MELIIRNKCNQKLERNMNYICCDFWVTLILLICVQKVLYDYDADHACTLVANHAYSKTEISLFLGSSIINHGRRIKLILNYSR